MLHTFINSLIEYLRIKNPVTITISTKEHKNVDGYYTPRYNADDTLVGHNVRVYMNDDSPRTIEATIAHELIHAWQEENSDNAVHGRRFAYRAKKLESEFSLTSVYIPRVDV
jgi:hypothetical protein